MDIKKPQLVKVEAFVLVFWVGSATPSRSQRGNALNGNGFGVAPAARRYYQGCQ